jgi:phage I-like protein
MTGAVERIRMAALTNDPGLDGMKAAALSAAMARLDSPTKEGNEMELLQKLLAAIGLPEGGTEDEALNALAALKAKADGVGKKDAEIAALKAAALDPAKYVPLAVVTELQNEVAALKAAQDKGTVDALFKEAREAGKVISPEYEAHLRTIPVAALKGVLDGLTAYTALSGMQSDTQNIGKDGKRVTSNDLAVMKALGLSPDEFAKGKD